MASYASYKKIVTDSIGANVVTASSITSPLNAIYGVQWFFGTPGVCSSGCCCLWTVPSGVKKLQIQLWGAGGNGSGACSCNRCHHYRGSGGGTYNVKTINVTPGWQYTICAAGVYPCCSFECVGCEGCSSYVNGCNLSNFCAVGGGQGYANTDWTETCNSVMHCCVGPTGNGGDWYQITHTGTWSAAEFVYDRGFCHCYNQAMFNSGAALIGTVSTQSIRECWIRCGCWHVPYGNGGQSAMTTYCGDSHCGQSGMGGGGLVKITYF